MSGPSSGSETATQRNRVTCPKSCSWGGGGVRFEARSARFWVSGSPLGPVIVSGFMEKGLKPQTSRDRQESLQRLSHNEGGKCTEKRPQFLEEGKYVRGGCKAFVWPGGWRTQGQGEKGHTGKRMNIFVYCTEKKPAWRICDFDILTHCGHFFCFLDEKTIINAGNLSTLFIWLTKNIPSRLPFFGCI